MAVAFKKIKIGDVGKTCMCKRIMKSETRKNSGIPFYKIGTFGKKADAYITNELYEKYKRTYSYPQKGDILISASGTIGRCVEFDGRPAYFQDSNIVWIDNNEKILLNRYFKYILSRIDWNVEGSTIKRLYNGLLSSTEIIIPINLKEQKIIANTLNNIDNLINSLQRTIEKKEKILEGAKKQFLYGTNWKKYTVNQIFNIGRGRVISNNEINSSTNNKYPVYSSQTTNNGIMGYLGTYDFEGDYITWTTDGANAGKVFYRTGRFNCTNVCGTLKLKNEGKFDYSFIAYLLNYECKKYVSTNLANPKLMNNTMGKVKISIPDDIGEQRNISRMFIQMEKEIDLLKQKLDKYKQIKKGMMEDLLTGKVRLNYEQCK